MDKTARIKQDIIELAETVFKENIPIRNICVSRAKKLNSINKNTRILYESRLFSNNLNELACGKLSANHDGALAELFKKIKTIRKQQLKDSIWVKQNDIGHIRHTFPSLEH